MRPGARDSRRSAAGIAGGLAKVVHGVHVLVGVYVFVGAFAVPRWTLTAVPHLLIVLWVVYVHGTRGTCPLTPLEQALRRRAGESSYEGGWTRHYVEPLLRPLHLRWPLERVIATAALAWNVAIYAVLFGSGRLAPS